MKNRIRLCTFILSFVLHSHLGEGKSFIQEDTIIFDYPSVWYGTMSKISGVRIADMNNDGRNDVVACYGDYPGYGELDGFRIMYQNVTGTLDSAKIYNSCKCSLSLDVADLDGDGKKDVVIAQLGGVRIFKQDPLGVFSDCVVSPSDPCARSVRIADFNNDGLKDIAVAATNFSDSILLRVYYQRPSMRFDSIWEYTLPVADSYNYMIDVVVEIGDIDGDGLMDIVLLGGTFRNAITIFLQSKTGGFFVYQTLSLFGHLMDIAVADFNNDGKPDIACGNGTNYPSYIYLFYQNSTGKYPDVPDFIPCLDVPSDLEVGDMDGDGLLDLVAVHWGWFKISIFKSNKFRKLSSPDSYAINSMNPMYHRSLAIGDLNNDGKQDIAIGNYDGFFLMLNNSKTTTGIVSQSLTPKTNQLYQNYPNPFNPSTNISFSLSSPSFVSLKVFDVLGKEVNSIVSEEMPAGTYTRQWNAVNIPSGIYFYRLQVGSFTETKKLVLLR